MEELNRRDLSWSEENLKKANPESEEPQKKRKRSVGQAHLKFQTRFGRHASLLSFFYFYLFTRFRRNAFLFDFSCYSSSKTRNVSIGIYLF